MPVISKVGRRSAKVRLLLAAIYLLLMVGGVTMVYPLLLMLAISLGSGADAGEFAPVPRYLYSADALFLKYCEERFGGLATLCQRYEWPVDVVTYETILNTNIVRIVPLSETDRQRVESYREFVRGLPLHLTRTLYPSLHAQVRSRLDERYREFVAREFGGSIARFNEGYQEDALDFASVRYPREQWEQRSWLPYEEASLRDFLELKAMLPIEFLEPYDMSAKWQQYLLREYDEDLKKYNQAHGTRYRFPTQIPLPARLPANDPGRSQWTTFVREKIPLQYLAPDDEGVKLWREFQRERGLQPLLNASPSLDQLRGRMFEEYDCFVRTALPLEHVRVDTIAERFAAFLKTKGRDPSEKLDGSLRLLDDMAWFQAQRADLRKRFLWRNYREVIDYVALHGHAFKNTVILVVLSVLSSLTVTPLCAYALSRFNLSYGSQILLFCLATMAFPAEVSMIPNFLLLRDLDLLNTYAALVLPGLASGFGIFLTKGFFDSLPKELYEAALIDGAGEMTLFTRITLPLSQPVLALTALNAFIGAYTGFMWALLVCQRNDYWTIMVWLYQFQSVAPSYLQMASLVVASVPTMLVFIFSQRVILRGIVLPQLH